MDIVTEFSQGLQLATVPINLSLIFSGAFLGTLVGALPGIRSIHCIAVLLPITYALKLPVESTLIFLLTIYYGCEYGGRVCTLLADPDQRDLSSRLANSALSSFCGGMIATVGLVVAVFLFKLMNIRFSPAEYFALVLFAFASLSIRTGNYPARTLVSICLGLMLASIGIDSTTGILRFTFGQPQLYDGIEFTTVVIGLFVVSEVFILLEKYVSNPLPPKAIGRIKLDWRNFADNKWSISRGALSGFFIGVLPGNGTIIASKVSEKLERQFLIEKDAQQKSEHGILLARETANNAAAGGTLVPLLALGIPGSGTGAILLGALLLYNITPGPNLFNQHTELIWAVIVAAIIGNLILLILNLPLLKLFLKANAMPCQILTSILLVLAFVGGFSAQASSFSLFLMVLLGLIGYLLEKWLYPLVPLLLGFVLGELLEDNLRRALAIGGGKIDILFASLTSKILLIMSAMVILLPLIWNRWKDRQG